MDICTLLDILVFEKNLVREKGRSTADSITSDILDGHKYIIEKCQNPKLHEFTEEVVASSIEIGATVDEQENTLKLFIPREHLNRSTCNTYNATFRIPLNSYEQARMLPGHFQLLPESLASIDEIGEGIESRLQQEIDFLNPTKFEAGVIAFADIHKRFFRYVDEYISRSPKPLRQYLAGLKEKVVGESYATAIYALSALEDYKPDLKDLLKAVSIHHDDLVCAALATEDDSLRAELLKNLATKGLVDRFSDAKGFFLYRPDQEESLLLHRIGVKAKFLKDSSKIALTLIGKKYQGFIDGLFEISGIPILLNSLGKNNKTQRRSNQQNYEAAEKMFGVAPLRLKVSLKKDAFHMSDKSVFYGVDIWDQIQSAGHETYQPMK